MSNLVERRLRRRLSRCQVGRIAARTALLLLGAALLLAYQIRGADALSPVFDRIAGLPTPNSTPDVNQNTLARVECPSCTVDMLFGSQHN